MLSWLTASKLCLNSDEGNLRINNVYSFNNIDTKGNLFHYFGFN